MQYCVSPCNKKWKKAKCYTNSCGDIVYYKKKGLFGGKQVVLGVKKMSTPVVYTTDSSMVEDPTYVTAPTKPTNKQEKKEYKETYQAN